MRYQLKKQYKVCKHSGMHVKHQRIERADSVGCERGAAYNALGGGWQWRREMKMTTPRHVPGGTVPAE